MAVQIACAACGRPLTGECEWGEEGDYDRTAMGRNPAVPRGMFVRLSEQDAVDVVQGDRIVERKVFSEAGVIACNPEDVLACNMMSVGVDTGCCGSDGCDGPNRACLCGSTVATQWSDCWTQAEVRFLPDAVSASRKI